MAELIYDVPISRLITDTGATVVDLPGPLVAGQTMLIVGGGGNVASSAGFAERIRNTTGNQQAAVLDKKAVGGETSVSITFNGAQNWAGRLRVYGPGLTFIGGSAAGSGTGLSTSSAVDFQIAPTGSVTLPAGEQGLLVSCHLEVTSSGTNVTNPFSLDTRWHQHGPAANAVDIAQQPGLASGANMILHVAHADVDADHSYPESLPAGQYRATSLWAATAGSNRAFVVQALYQDTSGVATTSFPSERAKVESLPGVVLANWYANDTMTGGIAGFCDQPSYLPGDTVQFKVDSEGQPFRVEIYQLGCFYSDLFGARNLVGGNQTYIAGTPVAQPDPTRDPVLGCVSCSAWTTTATWTIPDDALSSQCYVIFRRQDAGNTGLLGTGHFVIKDPSPTGLTIAIPRATEEAYNPWGSTLDHGQFGTGLSTGVSTYGSGPGANADPQNRAYGWSLDRPCATEATVGQTGIFDSQYGILQFLSRQGIDYSVVTDFDVHDDPTLLTQASAVIMLGHHEYWSDQMFRGFLAVRDSGLNMAVHSANTGGWVIRRDTTDPRKWICYKDNLSRDNTPGWDSVNGGTGIDPVTWTGTWWDPTPAGGRSNPTVRFPEALTGAQFVASGPTTAPMTLHSSLPWARHSPLIQAGTVDTTNSAGYEIDSAATGAPNIPTNLVLLASTQVATIHGTNPAGTLYDTHANVVATFSLWRTTAGGLIANFGWRGVQNISRMQGSSPVTSPLLDMQNGYLAAMYDLGIAPVTLSALRPGVDPALTDPAIGAPGPGNDLVALAYGLAVPAADSGGMFFASF